MCHYSVFRISSTDSKFKSSARHVQTKVWPSVGNVIQLTVCMFAILQILPKNTLTT